MQETLNILSSTIHGLRHKSKESVVLLRISKSCKRTDSDGFLKKSADPDSVSDSG